MINNDPNHNHNNNNNNNNDNVPARSVIRSLVCSDRPFAQDLLFDAAGFLDSLGMCLPPFHGWGIGEWNSSARKNRRWNAKVC